MNKAEHCTWCESEPIGTVYFFGRPDNPVCAECVDCDDSFRPYPTESFDETGKRDTTMNTQEFTTDEIMTKRFIGPNDPCPWGWTECYSGEDYKVIQRPERRSTAR